MPESPRQTFGQMLRAARTKSKLTQQELANTVSQRGEPVTQGYISLIERTAGTPKEPQVRFEVVAAIASILRMDREEALLAAGHNPDSPLRRLADADPEHIRMRLLMEFELVQPDGSTRRLTNEDLTPERRRVLADLLLSGELEGPGDRPPRPDARGDDGAAEPQSP